MVGFSIFQYFQIQDALSYLDQQDVFQVIKPLLITSIIVLAVCTMLFCYFDFKLFWEFGWKIYKKIGADPRKRGSFLIFFFFKIFFLNLFKRKTNSLLNFNSYVQILSNFNYAFKVC